MTDRRSPIGCPPVKIGADFKISGAHVTEMAVGKSEPDGGSGNYLQVFSTTPSINSFGLHPTRGSRESGEMREELTKCLRFISYSFRRS